MVHERSWSILISESIHLSIPFSGKNDGWKSASPYLSTCKVVSYCNPENENAAMDLKSIKPPVKPFCSLILSLSNYFFSHFAVGNVHDHVIDFKYGFFAFRAYPFTTQLHSLPCLAGSTWTSLVLLTHCYEQAVNKKFPVRD